MWGGGCRNGKPETQEPPEISLHVWKPLQPCPHKRLLSLPRLRMEDLILTQYVAKSYYNASFKPKTLYKVEFLNTPQKTNLQKLAKTV